jgi:hypothetical protein
MLILYPYILVSAGSILYTIEAGVIEKVPLSGTISGIIHPPTYLNKVLVWTAKEISIINIVTRQFVVQVHLEDIFAKLKQ